MAQSVLLLASESKGYAFVYQLCNAENVWFDWMNLLIELLVLILSMWKITIFNQDVG